MKHIYRLVLSLLLLTALFMTALVGTASAATRVALIPPCPAAPSFQTCDNQTVESQGCAADAITLSSANVKDINNNVLGTVLVRYSNYCKSAWAKIDSFAASSLYVELKRNGTFFSAASTNTTGTSIKT